MFGAGGDSSSGEVAGSDRDNGPRPGRWSRSERLLTKNGQFCPLTWDFRNDLSSCAAFCRQRARDDGATTRDFPSPPWALRQQFLKGER